jgi:hypothetical protein
MILEGPIHPTRGPLVRVTLRGPDGTEHEGDALLDTGTDSPIVDSSMIKRLHASIIGHRQAMGACPTECSLPQIKLDLRVGGEGGSAWETKTFGCSTSGVLAKGKLVACIGRDFLKRGRFTTDGPKGWWRFVTDDAPGSLAGPRWRR